MKKGIRSMGVALVILLLVTTRVFATPMDGWDMAKLIGGTVTAPAGVLIQILTVVMIDMFERGGPKARAEARSREWHYECWHSKRSKCFDP